MKNMKIDVIRGQVVYTKGINQLIEDGIWEDGNLKNVLRRHSSGDWTLEEMEKEDIEQNKQAIDESNQMRVFSVFHENGIKVYVITEWDRSLTTILLPDEY